MVVESEHVGSNEPTCPVEASETGSSGGSAVPEKLRSVSLGGSGHIDQGTDLNTQTPPEKAASCHVWTGGDIQDQQRVGFEDS